MSGKTIQFQWFMVHSRFCELAVYVLMIYIGDKDTFLDIAEVDTAECECN